MLSAQLPVRHVRATGELPRGDWPATVPAVRQVLDEGLSLSAATVLVGENGTGKSTLIEAIAAAYGLNPEGGTVHARHATAATESPLATALTLTRGVGTRRWGFFLRAETMHGLYSYLDEVGAGGLHELSHGESFLELLRTRFDSAGFYVLDEPESALSFSGCLALIDVLARLVSRGGQVLLGTHSPVVAALPGARILELDGDGLHETSWADTALVGHHRRFLTEPMSYLRHL